MFRVEGLGFGPINEIVYRTCSKGRLGLGRVRVRVRVGVKG